MIRRKRDKGRNSHVRDYKKPRTFSYRSSRKGVDRSYDRGETTQNTNKGARWWLHRAPYIACGVILLVVIFRSFLLDTSATLDVVGTDAYLRNKAEYQQAINDKLSGSLFNRFRITMNKQKISDEIEKQFPELQQVNIEVPMFSHRPIVEFKMASPAGIITSSGRSYVIDGDGRVLFDKNIAQNQESLGKLPVINDSSNTEISPGKPALTSDQVSYIRHLYLQAEAKGIKISSIELQPGGTEIRVRFGEDKYYVKFNLGADARQSIGTYFAASDKLRGEGSTPSEYIDVRVPERAFVK